VVLSASVVPLRWSVAPGLVPRYVTCRSTRTEPAGPDDTVTEPDPPSVVIAVSATASVCSSLNRLVLSPQPATDPAGPVIRDRSRKPF